MQAFESFLQSEISKKAIPGAVVAIARKDSIPYLKAFGATSTAEDASPLTTDSTFWFASCTKLATAICALQCVERELVKLDDDVSGLLPELKNLKIFKGLDEKGEPIVVDAKNKITLRMLLTHTSGMIYEQMLPEIEKAGAPQEGATNIGEYYNKPLIFEPGTAWSYSPSIDWAGAIVERVSNTTLGEYMQKHIWTPLSMTSTAFDLSRNSKAASNLSPTNIRNPDGTLATAPTTAPRFYPFDAGGSGTYSSAADYIKLLQAVLRDDQKLLQSSTRELLFAPQIDPKFLEATKTLPQGFRNAMFGGVMEGADVNFAFGGMRLGEDIEGGRREGTIEWSGLPNVYWWADRKSDLAGLLVTQVVPTGDEKVVEVNKAFDRAAYGLVAKN